MFLLLWLACASSSTGPAAGEPDTVEGGEACGEGRYGDVVGTLFVDDDAAPGGDGTQAAPFRSIGQAVRVAGDGDVIAVAAGHYPERLNIVDTELTVAGRCAELVEVDGTRFDDKPIALQPQTVRINLPNWAGDMDRAARFWRQHDQLPPVTLQGLTISGGSYGGIAAVGGSLRLRDVVVRGSHRYGMALTSVDATLEDVAVIESLAPRDEFAAGLYISDSRVQATRVLIADQRMAGVWVMGDRSTLLLEDVDIVDTKPSFEIGAAVLAEAGEVVLRDVRVDGGVNVGVAASYQASIEIDGLHIQDVTGQAWTDNACCPALVAGTVFGGSAGPETPRIWGAGLTVSDSDNGLWVQRGGTIELSDVHLSDLGAFSNVAGIVAEAGGTIELTDATIERAMGAAVLTAGDATVVLRDTEILDTRLGAGQVAEGASDDAMAVGVYADGGLVELHGVRIAGTYGSAVVADRRDGEFGRVVLRDVVIEDVGTPPVGARSAIGVHAYVGEIDAEGLVVRGVDGAGIAAASDFDDLARVRCVDCTVEDVTLAGLVAVGTAGGTELLVDGCRIADIAIDAASGLSTGVLVTHAGGPADVDIAGCDVSGTEHAAVVVAGEGAVQVRDSTLEGGSGALVSGVLEVHGNAVYATGIGAWDGSTGLRLEGNALSEGAGDTVLLHGAGVTLVGNVWASGGLRQQHCGDGSGVAGAEEAPWFEECPERDVVTVSIDARPVGWAPIDVDL